ncbi:hypothetical protein [Bradyrhizobium sp.]|uniref:hypothetical protein n=1 Tax=Bradyrhizobium sp. TaxID=376 RepID=UPI003C73293A
MSVSFRKSLSMSSAEISYRERCVSAFEWRVRRKAQLEEDARNRELQIEREEQEHQQRLEKGTHPCP